MSFAATTSEIAHIVGAAVPAVDVHCSGVSTDTRTLQPGSVFVGLNGERYRGADFVAAAASAGAAAAVTDSPADVALPQLQVADPLTALQKLAKHWRSTVAPVVVGITGSNGKTTMRSMVAACLGAHTHATEGNLNNHIGVPLTLLRLSVTHRFAVVEMGANHIGEIAALTSLARPDIGIVTNAGPAHLEGFGSLDGVAAGKGEMFAALDARGVAVMNRDDPYYPAWCEMAGAAAPLTFGAHDAADVRFSHVIEGNESQGVSLALTYSGQTWPVTLQLSGAHNAANAAGAAACALAAGIAMEDIVARLATVIAEPGRQRRRRGAHGGLVIDDSYNANPASMLAAARTVAATGERGWMVIGDMGELGAEAPALHAALGRDIRAAGVERLFCLGALSQHAAQGFGHGAQHFDSLEVLIETLTHALLPEIAVLIKGSRSMRMERVTAALAVEGEH
ncbi:MAG: UDP-N-acetylmuramoyl-tripeptide--D-alanyl-D-alanine ligase [Pseudomonadota bacterium]